MIRFRERMAGTVGPVARLPWTIAPRGPGAGDGVVRAAASTTGARPAVLDLDDLHVVVTGTDPVRDGWRARIDHGTVRGVAPVPLAVDCGFADLLTVAPGGRRMHYRLLVVHGPHRYVVEGVKAVRGGLRTAWTDTTTLHTLVVRIAPDVRFDASDRADGADRPDRSGRLGWLEAGEIPGEVVAAGVLRVRGLLRQGRSLRGPVLPFACGFVRRAVCPRPRGRSQLTPRPPVVP